MKLLVPLAVILLAMLAPLLGLVVVVVQPPQSASGSQVCIEAMQGDSDVRFDGDQLVNAATIVQVGQKRNIPTRGLVVAIAASLQESSLRNLPGGDRDSAGLFQMRPSTGWGSWSEVTDPVYAATAFFGGDDVPPDNPGLRDVSGWQGMSISEAAQAVERSASPNAYSRWANDAAELVHALTGEGLDCNPPSGTDCAATDLPAEGGLTPDAQLVVRCAVAKFGIDSIGGLAKGGHIAGSDHYTGRAVDLMISNWRSPAGTDFGDSVADYFVANVDVFGITYVIWHNRIWSTSHPTWRPYSHPAGRTDPSALHLDHVHVSVQGNSTDQRSSS